MIKRSVAFPGWMTCQASIALVSITTYACVILIGLRRSMTCRAGKDGVVVRVGMTVCTLIPCAIVSAAVDREILVVMIAVFGR